MKIGKFQVTQYKSHAGRKGRYRHTEGHPAQAGSMTGRCQVAGPEYCAKAYWQNITGKRLQRAEAKEQNTRAV